MIIQNSYTEAAEQHFVREALDQEMYSNVFETFPSNEMDTGSTNVTHAAISQPDDTTVERYSVYIFHLHLFILMH